MTKYIFTMKWPSLTAKIIKICVYEEKKFGRIDSWIRLGKEIKLARIWSHLYQTSSHFDCLVANKGGLEIWFENIISRANIWNFFWWKISLMNKGLLMIENWFLLVLTKKNLDKFIMNVRKSPNTRFLNNKLLKDKA